MTIQEVLAEYSRQYLKQVEDRTTYYQATKGLAKDAKPPYTGAELDYGQLHNMLVQALQDEHKLTLTEAQFVTAYADAQDLMNYEDLITKSSVLANFALEFGKVSRIPHSVQNQAIMDARK